MQRLRKFLCTQVTGCISWDPYPWEFPPSPKTRTKAAWRILSSLGWTACNKGLLVFPWYLWSSIGFYPCQESIQLSGRGEKSGEVRNQEDRSDGDYAVKVTSYQIKDEKLSLWWTPSEENGRGSLKSLTTDRNLLAVETGEEWQQNVTR